MKVRAKQLVQDDQLPVVRAVESYVSGTLALSSKSCNVFQLFYLDSGTQRALDGRPKNSVVRQEGSHMTFNT